MVTVQLDSVYHDFFNHGGHRGNAHRGHKGPSEIFVATDC